MDAIIGKDGKGAIVTLVEGNTNFTFARKLPEGRNAEALAQTVVLMLIPDIGKISSITTDNVSDFAGHQLIARQLKSRIIFAHPHSS